MRAGSRIAFARVVVALVVALASLAPDAGAQEAAYGTALRDGGAGGPYALTGEDALWAARMLVGEAGGADDPDNAAVLWCMINSYMLRPLRDEYPSFTAFVRAYCTPLQPYLKSSGAIERHRKRGTPIVEVEPGRFQLARHVELQKRPWAKLPASARALVERVFRGETPSPCGNATQFCSTATYFHDRHGRRPHDEELARFTEELAKEKQWSWIRVAGGNPRANAFFVEKRFAGLPPGAVTIARRKP